MKYIKSLDLNEELKGHAKKMKEDGVSDEEIKKMHPEVSDEDLNERFSDKSDFRAMALALKDGKTITARHARFPASFTVLEIDPRGGFAKVDYNDGKGSEEMAAMNIDPKSIKLSESVEINEAKGKKLVSDLYKMDAQVDYLSDADDKTKKIWKKAGINPEDDDQIILYSYVNSWPETKKLLDKSKVKYKELEDPNSAGESFIVFNVNEAKKFKPGDKWSNDFDYDGMLKYALKVNHKTPLKMLQKLHDSATDVNYHTPFSGLGNAIDWITDDGVNSQEGKDFMKQFHNDIKDEMKS
tara:strand:+ start:1288 stop:2178 length:891 start_codon:yes stop_codon:yes gene_type:complete